MRFVEHRQSPTTSINDITVYGFDQTVFYHNGDPTCWDRGRELG